MIVSEEDETDHNILTKQEKYREASIQLDNIKNMLCQFGTSEFLERCSELELKGRRLRAGLPLIPPDRGVKYFPDLPDNDPLQDHCMEAECVPEETKESTEFVLKWKPVVKSRGRPKVTSSIQVNFYLP